MSCIDSSSLINECKTSCCSPIKQPTSKVIGIIGRVYFEDFEPKGIIQSVVENSITYKMVSENPFLNGRELKISFQGIKNLNLEKVFYSQFKKRKNLRKR